MRIGVEFQCGGTVDKANPHTIFIGNYVTLGGNSRIITHCPVRSFRDNPNIEIGDYVYIGYGCCIVPGVRIGTSCIIGAGSVVTKDIPPYWVAAGNPCVPIRKQSWSEVEYFFKILMTRIKHKKIIGTSVPLPLTVGEEKLLNVLKARYEAK